MHYSSNLTLETEFCMNDDLSKFSLGSCNILYSTEEHSIVKASLNIQITKNEVLLSLTVIFIGIQQVMFSD